MSNIEKQKAAVKRDGTVIEFIKNPSFAIQKIAVEQNGRAIQFIENPSFEIQKAAKKRL